MSALAGVRVQRVRLTWPAYGQLEAEVSSTEGAPPPGLTTLVLGDLTLRVTVLPGRAGIDSPATWRGIARAGAGWGTILGKLHASYGGVAPVGVLLSTVLLDLSKDCDEPIEQPIDVTIGQTWSRPVSLPGLPFRGRDMLSLLRAQGKTGPHRVDPDGVTRWGIRPATVIPSGKARVIDRNLAAGWRKLSIDSPALFVPGSVFEGATIARVVITEDAESITCETWES